MEQSLPPKRPTNYKRGDRFKFENATWVVTGYSVSPSNEGYDERQWTLRDERSRQTAYLVHCIEEKDLEDEEEWIFSRPVILGNVLTSQDRSRPLSDPLPGQPPAELVFKEKVFCFKESYTTTAKDDEGNRVPKETWDYFDQAEGKNLCIEIWKEPDANYPEAYLGILINPKTLYYLGYKPVISGNSLKGLWVTAILPVILISAGLSVDYVLMIGLPVVALGGALILSPFALLIVAGATVMIGALLVTVFANVSGLWVGLLTMALATITVRLAASMKEGLVFHISWTCGLAAFVPAILYSFYVYFQMAPGPHNAGQLGATLLLPFIISGLTVLVNWGLGNLWPNTDSNV